MGGTKEGSWRRTSNADKHRQTPLDRDQAPQTRAQGRRGLLADVLARRNWEHTSSINALRERDRHLAGETAEVRSTSPAGRTPLTEIEHHNPEHTSAGDSTRTCLSGVMEST